MRFVIFAGLLSLVAAAPVQEEKRQTVDSAATLAFTGGAYPAFTPGAYPPEGSFTGSFVRPTGSFSRRPHGTGSFVRPTGAFTGSFVRPTGAFTGTRVRPTGAHTHTPHGTFAPPVPTADVLIERDEEAPPTGVRTPRVRPTGAFTGSFERPTGTRVHHGRPTGSFTGSFEMPTGAFTGTFEAPTGAPRVRPTGTRVRPSGGRHGRPTETAAVEPAAPSAADETTVTSDVEDPARI
jgi:hypothetical protein